MSETQTSRYALVFIFLTMFIDSVGIGIIIPVVPPLIRSLTHATLGEAATYGGWLIDASAGAQFLFAPLLGNLSDRFGRRPILLVSLFVLSLDFAVTGLAPTIAWLFVVRCLSGAASATYSTVNAYIADVTPPEKRAANFGLIGAAFGLGFVAGPGIGGFLSDYGVRIPFFAAAGLALANTMFGFFVLRESLAKKDRRPFEPGRANPFGSVRALARFPMVFGLMGVFVFLRFAHDANPAIWTYFTMLKFHWTSRDVAYSLMAVGVMISVVSGFLTRVAVARFGEDRSAYLGLFAGAVGYIGYAISTRGWMLYGWMALSALMGLAIPSLNAIISRQVGPDEQGELQGALASLGSLTSLVAVPLLSYIFAWFTSPGAPVYFPGAAYLAAALSFLAAAALLARTRGTPALSPAPSS